jgi:hypothetical protein
MPKPEPKPEKKSNPGGRPGANPSLDSFDAVMAAMDTELARQKAATSSPRAKAGGTATGSAPADAKGKAKAKVSFADADEDELDIEAAMDAELRGVLAHGDADSDEEAGGADYALIKNFLESFKSQAGLAGPVGNLAGRLQAGWTMPRDEA